MGPDASHKILLGPFQGVICTMSPTVVNRPGPPRKLSRKYHTMLATVSSGTALHTHVLYNAQPQDRGGSRKPRRATRQDGVLRLDARRAAAADGSRGATM